MRHSSLFVFFLLTATAMLMGLNTSHVEGRLSTNAPPPKPAPTVYSVDSTKELDLTFEQLDAYEERNPKKVKVEVKGRDETNGKVIIKLKDSKTAPELVQFGGGDKYTIDLSILTVPETYILNAIASIFNRDPNADSFPGVEVKQIGNTPIYEVTKDYSYAYKGSNITVPKGFRYDRASIPRVFWVVIDKDSLSNVAPLFHDLLYRFGGVLETKLVVPYRRFSRDEADNLFYELMGKCGVEEWRRSAAYEAVHTFAKSHWQGH